MVAPVKFFSPPELLEQGLGLVLSGLNNTMAVQSNLDWIWPLWIEHQKNPHKKEFIPTGVNFGTANLSMRNWTFWELREAQRGYAGSCRYVNNYASLIYILI